MEMNLKAAARDKIKTEILAKFFGKDALKELSTRLAYAELKLLHYAYPGKYRAPNIIQIRERAITILQQFTGIAGALQRMAKRCAHTEVEVAEREARNADSANAKWN